MGSWIRFLTAKDAKHGFGRLINLARPEPVMIAKHGRHGWCRSMDLFCGPKPISKMKIEAFRQARPRERAQRL